MRHPHPAASIQFIHVVRVVAVAAIGVAPSACVLVANNGTSLAYRQNRSASSVARLSAMPTSLGQHVIGTVALKRSAILSADSTLRAFGWTIAAFDTDRGTLRTDWGYAPFDGLSLSATQGCDPRNTVPVRLFLEAHAVGALNDSTRFTLRGETAASSRDDRGEQERTARRAFEAMTAALQETLLGSDTRSPSPSTSAHGAVGGVVDRDGFALCATAGS